jgi:outer membrane protein TolC
MSLDDAIRIALLNSEVIRVLGGSSGQTVYDPAIANTQIDEQRGRFDPQLQLDNNFRKTENPGAEFDPAYPQVRIDGTRRNDYDMGLGVSKTTNSGGTAEVRADTNSTRWAEPGTLPLNPQVPSSAELSFTQPLLRGGGFAVNMAPIEIARIDTERSFFQMKGAVQRSVRDVISAYWALVFARADLWARQKQVEQGTWGYEYAKASAQVGRGDIADVAQARSALAGYRASEISAQANVLQREAALRNILGLPPSTPPRIIPVTPLSTDRMEVDWRSIVDVAAQRRPDLIELKLIIEADQQQILIANSLAKPQLDAVALYRWNGLEGRTPVQAYEISRSGQFTDWLLGVNFSVPLGLREARAALRQQELIIMRDRANLHQALHESMHILADNYRNLALFYDLYEANKETRAASAINLDAQTKQFGTGFTIYLNVIQAITSWGNAVSAEAQSLAEYNAELASLQTETGVILEAHGIRFVEERYGSIGPLGRWAHGRCYPKAERPCPDGPRYPVTEQPAEEAFDLQDPVKKINRGKTRQDLDSSPMSLPNPQQPRPSANPGDLKLLTPLPSTTPERVPTPPGN